MKKIASWAFCGTVEGKPDLDTEGMINARQDPQHREVPQPSPGRGERVRRLVQGNRVTGQPLNLKVLSESSGVLLTEGGVVHPGRTSRPRSVRSGVLDCREGERALAARLSSQ